MKDFCSNFPDNVDGVYIGGCCKEHDAAYTIPGDRFARLVADKHLRACIAGRSGKPWLGTLMYVGVRMFGWTPWHFNRTIFGAKS